MLFDKKNKDDSKNKIVFTMVKTRSGTCNGGTCGSKACSSGISPFILPHLKDDDDDKECSDCSECSCKDKKKKITDTVQDDGCFCRQCNSFLPMVEPDSKNDGKALCYGCANPW